jgi:stage IV sporulation protein B
VASDEVREYDIYIESVNRFASDDTKGMVIRITDPALIKLTNGIVQGMSGSPILQNGRLIGAVTHVFVQDPTKGYGIFIENMIRQDVTMK